MSIYSKNHTYLGNADKICRFIGRKYKSQFWPNISSRYISLYLWIYVPLTYLGNNNKICRYISLYITQEKWAKNLVDFFLIVAVFLSALHGPLSPCPPWPLTWITQRRRLVLYQCISLTGPKVGL